MKYNNLKVGDWVETCNMLPGIVQKIDGDDVEIFYPHYAFKYPGEYYGGSLCSIKHCGVHKIAPEYAMALMAIGEERLLEIGLAEQEKGFNQALWETRIMQEYDDMIRKLQKDDE